MTQKLAKKQGLRYTSRGWVEAGLKGLTKKLNVYMDEYRGNSQRLFNFEFLIFHINVEISHAKCHFSEVKSQNIPRLKNRV